MLFPTGKTAPVISELDATMSELLSQCLEIAKHLIDKNQMGAIAVKVGDTFEFSFSNQETEVKKRKSPCKLERDKRRKIIFENRSLDKEKVEPEDGIEKKVDFKISDLGIQTERLEYLDEATQTDINYEDKECQTNPTDREALKINGRGEIEPEENEIIIELRVSHEFKTFEDIKQHVTNHLKLELIGNPWLANSGNHFKTVAFRTSKQGFENWKNRNLNWETANVRPVSVSRIYR